MKYVVTLNNKNYEVEVENGEASIIKTTEAPQNTSAVKSVQAQATIPTPTPAPAPSASTGNAPVNGEVVKAPMPGVILDVKVSSGTKVKKGDVVFILEAMKMENEIVSPVDGVIAQISTAKGSSVSTGDALAVIQ